MASNKKIHKWNKVRAGDIISFKYISKDGRSRLQTILVLNPRLRLGGSDKLIGLKLENNNKIELKLTSSIVEFLQKLGKFKKVDPLDIKSTLYRLDVDQNFLMSDIKGVKQGAYKKIAANSNINTQYRTYNYQQAKGSSVYLNEVKFFTILEDQGDVGSDVDQDAPSLAESMAEMDKKPGEWWIRSNNLFAAKNKDKRIKAFKKKNEALSWSKK
jgi:hypothetical protein